MPQQLPNRHPPGFLVLFFTELWERFGYYLLRALLVIYMTKRLGMTDAQALEMFGTFQGFVYLTPPFGGLLADRVLGLKRAVLIGGCVIAAGHLIMTVESRTALILAMGFIVVGNGLFKPNMQSLLSALYKEGDPRHEQAFSRYYLAVNIGAMVAPLLGTAMVARLGWGFAFGSAAVGHCIGLATFWTFRRHLVDNRSPLAEALDQPLDTDATSENRGSYPADTGRRVAAIVAVAVVVSLFWAVYLADGGSLTLWAKECVAGLAEYATLTNAINPIGILVLTPIIEWTVGALNRRRRSPIGPIHMLLAGLLLSAAAAALLRIGAAGSAKGVSVAWLLGFYLLITIGELLVSPIGTALVARLAPQRLRGFLLGVWLLSSSVGGFVSGQIGRVAWPALSHSGYFAVLAGVGLAGAALVLLLWRPLSRLVGSGQPPKELEAVQRWEEAGKQIAKLRLVPKMRKAA